MDLTLFHHSSAKNRAKRDSHIRRFASNDYKIWSEARSRKRTTDSNRRLSAKQASSLATWAGELAETLFFAGNDETFKMVTSTAVQSTIESKTSGVTKGKAVAAQGLSTALAAAPAATPPIVTGYAANTTKAPGPIKKA